jgi:hypothetical protein
MNKPTEMPPVGKRAEHVTRAVDSLDSMKNVSVIPPALVIA